MRLVNSAATAYALSPVSVASKVLIPERGGEKGATCKDGRSWLNGGS